MKIFYLPDLGEGLAEAEIREWYVKVNDEVKVDQPLVSMETAKAVVDVPSPYAGKVTELHGKVNDIIQTGAPLISFKTNNASAEVDKGSVVGSLEESSQRWEEKDVLVGAPKRESASIKAMPAARVLAKEMQVDLAAVTPTGPRGLITAEDVKKFLHSKTVQRSHEISGKVEKLHGVRRVMAQVMQESHQVVAPSTIIDDADITDLPREADLTAQILLAIKEAVAAEPALNAWFNGKTLEREVFQEIHLGLAVDTEDGLFVPVIKNAEKKTGADFRKIIDEFKTKVKTRTLSPEEMQGATLILSNFGTISGRYATPIIVPPMVAILGSGRYRDAALPRNGKIVAGRILPLSLTFDHRAVTGGEATRFLAAVIQYLQSR